MSKADEFDQESLRDIHSLSYGRGLKADVSKAKYNGQWVVIKDYSGVPRCLSFAAKILVRREVAALKHLQSESNIVSLLKVIDPYRFMMEYIEGEHPGKACQDGVVYDNAVTTLLAMHKVGVAHNDLRRKNLILHPQRGLVLIDFGAATIRSRHSSRSKIAQLLSCTWLMDKLQLADIYHLVKLKKYLSNDPLTDQELMILRSGRPFRRITYLWKVLFRGKRGLLIKGATLWQATLAKLLSPMRLGSDQSALQRHE